MKEGYTVCFSVFLWRCEWEQLRLCDINGIPWLILHWECGEPDPLGKVIYMYLVSEKPLKVVVESMKIFEIYTGCFSNHSVHSVSPSGVGAHTVLH